MISATLLCLLLAAPPEPTYEQFLEATKYKNESWALGAARRRADTWMALAPRYVERLESVAAAEPARAATFSAAARDFRAAQARLEAAYQVDFPAWERRCGGAVEALGVAYEAAPGSVGQQELPTLHARAKACAADFSGLVRRIEEANRELAALHRGQPPEVARALLAVQPPPRPEPGMPSPAARKP